MGLFLFGPKDGSANLHLQAHTAALMPVFLSNHKFQDRHAFQDATRKMLITYVERLMAAHSHMNILTCSNPKGLYIVTDSQSLYFNDGGKNFSLSKSSLNSVIKV